jgi:hypothetical protein
MRNDEFDRRPGARDSGMGGLMLGIMVAIALAAALYFWSPWNGPKIADNTAPGTTVGSTTTRPTAPAAPTAPAPTTIR